MYMNYVVTKNLLNRSIQGQCTDTLFDTLPGDITQMILDNVRDINVLTHTRTNGAVLDCWVSGYPNNTRDALHTDGNNLYSYDLEIGMTRGGQKLVKDYTAKGAYGFMSQTTSTHVNLALCKVRV